MAIVATKEGTPGFVAVAVDDTPSEDVMVWIRRGYAVRQVDDEEARRGFGEFLDWQIAKRKAA